MEESSGKFDMQVNENQTLLGKTDGNLMDDGLGKLGDMLRKWWGGRGQNKWGFCHCFGQTHNNRALNSHKTSKDESDFDS